VAAQLLSHQRQLPNVALDFLLYLIFHSAQQVFLHLFHFPVQYPLLLTLNQLQFLPLLLELNFQLPVGCLDFVVLVFEEGDFLVQNGELGNVLLLDLGDAGEYG